LSLDSFIAMAREQGASDLHLEAGLPGALRVRGTLRTFGQPVPPHLLAASARSLIGEDQWPVFLERRSYDLSRTIHGVRCRINVLQTARGIGFAIRLLAAFEATIEKLNLHPELKKLVAHQNGLVLISGPTGSGKSSTLAALIQEINLTETRHIVTIESPIEYAFRSRRSYIRQREVGRDTPSFDQALLDALREDPDVVMVGEMREPETMRLTLNASETGHLVLATIHSATCIEALQRIVSAFPAQIQDSVSSQLADCLVGVVAQRLRFHPELNMLLPECEILTPSHAVKNFVRNREFFKMASVIETGASQGMWTFQRYQTWMEKRGAKWETPGARGDSPDTGPGDMLEELPPVASTPIPSLRSVPKSGAPAPTPKPSAPQGPIEIEPVEGGLEELLKKLE
jgi:twitching motility protein PilT